MVLPMTSPVKVTFTVRDLHKSAIVNGLVMASAPSLLFNKALRVSFFTTALRYSDMTALLGLKHGQQKDGIPAQHTVTFNASQQDILRLSITFHEGWQAALIHHHSGIRSGHTESWPILVPGYMCSVKTCHGDD